MKGRGEKVKDKVGIRVKNRRGRWKEE